MVADSAVFDSAAVDSLDAKAAGETAIVTGGVAGLLRLDGLSNRSGFEVQLVGKGTTKTAVDGSFAFEEVPVGVVTVIARVPSTLEGSKTVIVAVGSGTTAVPEMVFTPVGEIGGTATFGTTTGNAGIAVLAGADRSATTDDAGNYVLKNVPLGTKDLLALYPERPSATAKGVTVEFNKRAVAPDLVLVKAPVASGEMHGTITVTGESAHDGVIVLAIGPTGKSYGAVSSTAGAWSIAGLPDGEYALRVTAPSTVEGSRTAKVTVDKSKSVAADAMTFTPLGTLKGKATLGGGATANAGIMVWVPDVPAVSTNDAGEWEIRGVRTGVSTISASRSGWGTKSVAGPTLHWRETLTASTIDLTIDSSALSTIAGKALLPGVSTHDGTVVTVSGSGVTATTSADGSYSLKVGGDPTRRTVSFKSKDGRYNGSLDVLLMPGASAVWLRNGAGDAIPTVRLVRGTRIGRGLVLTTTSAGDVIALVQEPSLWTPSSYHIDRIAAAGVTTTLVADAPAGAATSLATSDGQWIAYSQPGGSYVPDSLLLDTTAGTTVKLGSPSNPPWFSEDQKSIAYVDSQLHVRRLATGVTVDVALSGDCVLSPTASSVARASTSELKVARVAAGTTFTSLGYPPSTTSPKPVWTSDERLFHLTAAGGLGVFDFKATAPADVEVFSSGLVSLVRSADGRHVVAVRATSSSTSEVQIVASGSTTGVRLGASVGPSFPAAFSPDSTRVAWAASDGVYWAPVSAPASAVKVMSLSEAPFRLWFMGNDALVAQLNSGGFAHARTSGSTGAVLPYARSYAFSPDTTKLFTMSDSPATIRILDASGTVSVSSPGIGSWTGPWSPDSARATGVIAYGYDEYFNAAIVGSSVTPLGWPARLRWLDANCAVLGIEAYPAPYSGDDSLWLATLP